MNPIDTTASERSWRGLYLAAGAAALLSALAVPFQMALFIAWPPPAHGTAADWFAMFQANPVHGLLSLDLVMMAEQVLVIPVALALYRLLHRANESTMALALAAWLVGAGLFVASNTAFQMLTLSNGYAAAGTDAARAPFLAAGEVMLATYWGMGTPFVFGYVLSATAGVLVGLVMLQTRLFGRAAAWAALAGNVVGLGIFLPGIGTGVSLASVLVLWVWYVLIGVRLVRLGRSRTVGEVAPSHDPALAAA
ncbi:MAG: hypothetical protein M0Z49_13370 [Chloroflexi bacterium]|nr:hypothetical protein [Chloroflexota bacterium]